MTINKQELSSDNSTWFAQGWNATMDMITYWFSSPSNLNKNNEFFVMINLESDEVDTILENQIDNF